jgi:hypothetical protein
MAETKIIYTVIGKKNLYEVVKHGSSFYVHRSGTRIDGPYSDLRRACEKAQKEVDRES